MSHPQDIIRLYSTVLFHDLRRKSVSEDDMKTAISDMQRVYMPEPKSLSSTVRRMADYNSVAYRCAYLHKYAPFHTAMVCDIMRCILQRNDSVYYAFQKLLHQLVRRQKFKFCSVGGGPGSDTVGVLVAMFEHFGLFPCLSRVIDIKSDWKDTLSSVIRGLRSGACGPVGECFRQPYFNWEYLTADLLEEVHDDVKSAIGSADLVTMVKFVSAAACESTEWMLKKIFTMMKLGAFVLFIDNSSGGFRQLVSKAATFCNLTSVCGPIDYQLYTNEAFNITHWGITSCYSTTITVHMMQKLRPSPFCSYITSKNIVDAPQESNSKLSNTCSNDVAIRNELPIPSSNETTIRKIITDSSSNINLIQKDFPTANSNGSLPDKLSTPSSNSNIIQKELLTPSSCVNAPKKEFPISDNPIQIQLPGSGNSIQNELPTANSCSIPIQNEIASISQHTIHSELISDKHDNPTNILIENQSSIQIKGNKFPIQESTENVPSTERNRLCGTEVPILKEIQNSDCLNLSPKYNNGYPISSKDLSCLIIDSKSKNRKRANQSNQNGFNEFKKRRVLDSSPTSFKGIYATENSKSRDSYNNHRCEELYTRNSASELIGVDLKACKSSSIHVDFDVEVSDLKENVQEIESVENPISSVFDASTKNLLHAKTDTSPSKDSTSKCSSCCAVS